MSENVQEQIEDQEFILKSENELRFEVENKNETAVLELKSGFAEIFGTELIINKRYTFYFGSKIAVFTWQGCTLKLRGKKGISYISKETPMTFYLNCHAALEQLRIQSEKEKNRGPVTLIVGPTDVGKSTLCRILLNYCVRMNLVGRKPIFVDLDSSQGQISVPSTIGAVMIERQAEVEDSFFQAAPLVFHCGHTNMNNKILYKTLISRMAEVIHGRMDNNPKIKYSGIIINTCGWTKDEGYETLNHIALAFEVNVIFVLDQERLYNELLREMPDFVKVVLLPKNRGVVVKSKKFRSERREACIREYFYGTPRNVLHPHICNVKFSDIKVYKIGAPPISSVLMPIDTQNINLDTKLVPVIPGPNMIHHILSISLCTSITEKDVVRTNVVGFVCVINVNLFEQMLTLLSPQPTPLLDNIYLLTEVQFMDNND